MENMSEEATDAQLRQRRESVETITTKLIFQRQSFVQYMPAVYLRHFGTNLGEPVMLTFGATFLLTYYAEFPHKFAVKAVQAVHQVASLSFDEEDVKTITENIRFIHHLAVSKPENANCDKPYKNSPQASKQTAGYQPQPPYDCLPLSASSIRVLKVLPATRGSPISCQLSTVTSVHQIEYQALSYVWGNKDIIESIIVNHHIVQVTRNLFNALQSVRNSERPTLLWVDAICIDQSNELEKNVQVAMMGDIYLAAKTVCVYLGEADSHSETLLHTLEQHETIGAKPDAKIYESDNWPVILEYLASNQIPIFQSLVSIMSREWFKRIWVYQEFHLAAKQPRIYVGSHSLSASVVFGALFGFLMESCGQSSVKTVEVLQPLLEEYRDFSLPSLPHNFIQMKRQAHLCRYAVQANDLMPRFPSLWLADPAIAAAEATNPLDKIFGISGMFDPISKAILYPDYGIPVREVFMRATAWCLMIDDTSFYTFFRYRLLQDPEYPSWVLDFEHPLPYDEVEVSTQVSQERVFPDLDHLAAHCIVKHQVLYIVGLTFTTIEELYECPHVDMFERLKQLWQLERQLAIGSQPNGSDAYMTDSADANASHMLLSWAADFPGNLVSFLAPHASLYCFVLSNLFPSFRESADYSTWIGMQELLGALLFDGDRFIQNLYIAVQHTTADIDTEENAMGSSALAYNRLLQALLGGGVVENAYVLRIIYDVYETMIPTIYDMQASEVCLNQHGFSSTDPHFTAKTFVAMNAAEGRTISIDDALPLAKNLIYDHANRRNEYSQRLLNSTFFTTTSGLPGCGPEGTQGYRKGDEIVFLRKMPIPVAIRPCNDGSGAYRFVGIVQLKGLIDGSLYETKAIKEGSSKLFSII